MLQKDSPLQYYQSEKCQDEKPQLASSILPWTVLDISGEVVLLVLPVTAEAKLEEVELEDDGQWREQQDGLNKYLRTLTVLSSCRTLSTTEMSFNSSGEDFAQRFKFIELTAKIG